MSNGKDIHFQANQIRNSGGYALNEAVNAWSFANSALDQAVIVMGALGPVGESSGVRAQFEELRKDTMQTLAEGVSVLIEAREAIFLTADQYEGVETKIAKEVGKVIPHHRPEIDRY
ncbi:hypothetical protein [Actinomadura harenae]|uniref:ESX-1 secretion-associated protein n=1 Tax=Actinomadura harenae TaxID=2483351 RepID=A0A3M2MD83_9ACTN|nr:hypothetical protein [Actinomadura harenae]RMI47471.1 hypothetical protein EBO15_02925 [Actinomadura harenae]